MLAVQKCVIPLAGLGTRLYPATKSVPKALFPVIDADGKARPLIHVLMQESLSAGIEKIGLVVHPSQLDLTRSYFEGQAPDSVLRNPALRSEFDSIREMGNRITWILQENPLGFGDAILRSRDFVGQDPFLVQLGDHLFQSANWESCASQMCAAFRDHGMSILGVVTMPPEELTQVASVAGAWVQEGLYKVDRVAEKPGPSWAATHGFEGVPGGWTLGAFGMDVFTPEVFDPLVSLLAEARQACREVQLRDAQDRLARSGRLLALRLEAERYDLGEPDRYARNIDALWTAKPRGNPFTIPSPGREVKSRPGGE